MATLAVQRGAYGSLFGHNLFTIMSASIGLGRLTIQDSSQSALNEAGANTGGTYSKANLAFSGNLDLAANFSSRGSVSGCRSPSWGTWTRPSSCSYPDITGVKAYTGSGQLR